MGRVFVGTGWVQSADGLLGGSLVGRLSGRENALFQRLALERGQVVSTEDLERAIWGDARSDSRRVKVLMQRLRNKVEPEPSEPRFVITVLRQGYRLAADEVQTAAAPSPPTNPVSATVAARVEAPLPVLFGRSRDQARLEEWLLHRHGRWLTLTGVGGVGKSALLEWAHARAVAEGLASRWVSLGDVETVEALLERIARAGRLPLPPQVEPEPLLASALRGRQGLWVLDDLSRLNPGALETLDRLFAPLDGVRVLTSRREPLRSLDEAVLPVLPLDADAAAAMYRSLTQDPSAAAPAHVPLLPLWVRLAAASGGDVPAEHLTPSELVEAAVDRAPAPEALQQLGWHPSEARAEMLVALLEVSSEDLEAWRRAGLIEALPDGRMRVHALIRDVLRARSARVDRLGRGRRLQLERLIRYVRVEAGETFEQQPMEVRRRVLDYLDLLLGWVRGVRPTETGPLLDMAPVLVRVVLGSGRERAWVETLEGLVVRLERRGEATRAARIQLAIANLTDWLSPADQQLQRLLVIRREMLDAEHQDHLDLMLAVSRLTVGQDDLAVGILEAFHDRVPALTPSLRVRYRTAWSAWLRRASRHEEAVQQGRAAVVEARTAAPMLETRAYQSLMSACQEGGFIDEGWQVLQQVQDAAERWDDLAALALSLRQQAQQAMLARRAGQALERAERALALEYPGSVSYVYALYTAAVAHRQVGSFTRSVAVLEDALAEAREQRLTRLEPLILDSLGNALVRQQDLVGALERYDQAMQATLAIGDTREARRIHSNIAYAHLLDGDVASALRHQEPGRDDDAMPAGWRAAWEWREAAVRFANGEPARACAHLRQVVELARELESLDLACEAAALAASWLYELGETERAVAIGEAITLSLDMSHLVRRLPAALRVAVERPAEADLESIAALVTETAQHPALVG